MNVIVDSLPSYIPLLYYRLSRKRHVKERLSHRKPKTKSGKRELIDVEIQESMTDEEVGLAIAEGLMERKPELIGNSRSLVTEDNVSMTFICNVKGCTHSYSAIIKKVSIVSVV